MTKKEKEAVYNAIMYLAGIVESGSWIGVEDATRKRLEELLEGDDSH